MLGLHDTFFKIVLGVDIITLIIGIVCIVLSRRSADANTEATTGTLAQPLRIFRIALWVTEGIGVLQAIFGVLLLSSGKNPSEPLHFVYGFIVVGAIPIAYVYSDQKDVRRDVIIMTIATFLIVGAAIRAYATGGAA